MISNDAPQSLPQKASFLKKVVIPFFLVLLLLILSPFILLWVLVMEIPLRLIFLSKVLSTRKFILFVYSDSPIWKQYLEDNILPRIREHAFLLNWSERGQWDRKDWKVWAFRHWGGRRDFNPLAIMYCNFFKVKTIRFYRPFQDYKHGKEHSLHQAESQLFDLVDRIVKG